MNGSKNVLKNIYTKQNLEQTKPWLRIYKSHKTSDLASRNQQNFLRQKGVKTVYQIVSTFETLCISRKRLLFINYACFILHKLRTSDTDAEERIPETDEDNNSDIFKYVLFYVLWVYTLCADDLYQL